MSINMDQVKKVSKILKVDEDTVVEWVEQIDPTENNKYNRWILKVLATDTLILPEDVPRFNETIAEYIEKSDAGVLRSNDLFEYSGIVDLEKHLAEKSDEGSKKKQYCQVDPLSYDGVELLKEIGEYKLYAMNTADAIMDLGEGTKWCTRRSYSTDTAQQYLDSEGRLFLVLRAGRLYCQFNPKYTQVMDVNDHAIRGSDMEEDFINIINIDIIQERYNCYDMEIQ